MRYLLLILFFALQTIGVSANAIDLQENSFKKELTYKKSSVKARSYKQFRYYSPENGQYISQDPIGLSGNNPNLYAYVRNSNIQVDVFGLDLIVIVGEGQAAVEKYAKKMRELFPEHEWKTIKKDWGSIVENSGAKKEVFGSAEWEAKANQGNADWIIEQHNKGSIFADIGYDDALNRSSFYQTELDTIKELDAKKFKGSKKWINWSRENSKKSNRPKSKINYD